MIKNIDIHNFKSIKSVAISDCKRINVFIGRPNVGKSNILEALAMFDVPYLMNSSTKSLKSLVRIETPSDLFYNGLSNQPIKISADDDAVIVTRNANNGLSVDLNIENDLFKFSFSPSLQLSSRKTPASLPSILAYFFPKIIQSEPSPYNFLLPPSGNNLMQTVANLPALKTQLAELFHSYGLKMLFDAGSQEIKAMRENGLDMFLIPFSSLADSLQRLIFYKAAIESNQNKSICFEEPEAHTFPPYISNIVNDIIVADSNQFFITTHSPYVLSSLLEASGNQVSLYVVDMKDNETKVRRLTDTELQKIYDDGIDMFFNIEAFFTDGQ